MTRAGEPSQHAGVAYALDASGQVVEPETATADQRYVCLACEEVVSLVRAHQRLVGDQLRPWRAHFSHRSGSTCTAGGESIQHLASKRWLQQAVTRHRSLTVELSCPDCQRQMPFEYWLLPSDVVANEVPTGAYRADVAVLQADGRVDFVIEIRHTHQVTEPKAIGLDVAWVEIDSRPDLGMTRAPQLVALNTNLFSYLPCEQCGNDAASYPLALERRAVRLEQERRQRHAELLQRQAERQAAFARQQQEAQLAHQRAVRLALEQERRAEAEARQRGQLAAERAIETFLVEHVPDARSRLLVFTCVLGRCPGCDAATVFFDPTGMNWMPTWTPLAWRASPFHPLECACLLCGWHGPQPPPGQRITFHQPVSRSGPAADTKPKAAGPDRFWWQDRDQDP